MVTQSTQAVEVLRAPRARGGRRPRRAIPAPDGPVPRDLHLKGAVLRRLARAGARGLWDHEIMRDALDEGSHFGAGKILKRFRLSPFGAARMAAAGLDG